ncbi:hypothetical protein HMPREF9445_01928 [Bacteroides clarus YIT 12056]|uniref:Uncharacterized protein n=1 Tax=Bacteroides clarus YIT 12056 TaxID=762984 RepID=A0ABN0CN33_9BACE|nr:hypothetical protein HMPREF9445_01928 [Bacteroides clarus YIT 12056]
MFHPTEQFVSTRETVCYKVQNNLSAVSRQNTEAGTAITAYPAKPSGQGHF